MPSTDVYATARGPVARLASPIAARLRARRHGLLAELTGVRPGDRVLDVGCGTLGLRAQQVDLDITGTDLVDRPTYPGPFVRADATVHLPFDDGAFDLVHASSVIEHIPPHQRAAFARELLRVGRGVYVQTPAYSFPVEPHALLPIAHWLPVALRRPYWRLGAQGHWEDVRLLRRGELAGLFPSAAVHAEALGPLTKSWMAVRPVR
ncbi:methyltransferase domain-containing protein [Patulibacter sp. NPDC049589]|uniref:class I SAM-dependent methyltransferase n=1 Tax=Patulibacter sp. NPDC049589 TaxID=3154731 RepID=UPI003447FA2B